MPKKSQIKKQRPKSFYRKSPPIGKSNLDFLHAKPIPSAHFELREDGSIVSERGCVKDQPQHLPRAAADPAGTAALQLIFRSDSPFIRLYHGNCLELLDAIAAKYPDGRFDAIFADPPYFLSNGGITCHAGRMVKVDKGDWDISRGTELNHEFNREWLARCQKVLKPNGTIWVSGTHHVIFSIGYAMQQLGYKILNDIAWEKPNPPPNLSCRYFTHSTETILSETINGSRCMADVPQIETERIYHECKFVFLSAAQVERGAVVHTTVDVSLQEAWAKTPNGKKRETTHVVRCETEIFRIRN